LRSYDLVRTEILYNIELDIPMELVWLIEMCLNEIYGKAGVVKYLSCISYSE
jgi:hypothetical protein